MKAFLAAAAAAAALGASAASAQQGASLRCGGTEPFWGLTITAQAMWFTNFDQQRVDLVLVKPEGAMARPLDNVRVYRTRRAKGAGAVTLVVKRNYESCSDGMSDKRYAYDAVYIGPEGVLEGCCSWAK